MLAADPGRHASARSTSWPSTASRAWSAAARPRAARCTTSCCDWQAAHAKLGKQIELGERLCFGFHFYIADSTGAGHAARPRKYYEENMKMFGELRLVRALTDEQIEIMRDPKRAPTAKLPRIEDAVKAGGFLTRLARRDHRAPEGAGEALSRPRPHLGQPVGRRAEIGLSRAARTVRQGGDAGLQRARRPNRHWPSAAGHWIPIRPRRAIRIVGWAERQRSPQRWPKNDGLRFAQPILRVRDDHSLGMHKARKAGGSSIKAEYTREQPALAHSAPIKASANSPRRFPQGNHRE